MVMCKSGELVSCDEEDGEKSTNINFLGLQSLQEATNSTVNALSCDFSDSSTKTDANLYHGDGYCSSDPDNEINTCSYTHSSRRVKAKTLSSATYNLYENSTLHMSKYDHLRAMFALSKVANLQKQVLPESVLMHRMACIQGMQHILHYSKTEVDGLRMSDNLVEESTVVQSIFLLDWIIVNEFNYFVHMKTETLSAVCLILNSGHLEHMKLEEVYRIASFAVYASEKPHYQRRLEMQVERIQEQVWRRHTRIVFADFIRHYFAHDCAAMQRMTHFFYIFITGDPDTWELNTYETFVEIALKECNDVQTNMDILDDYLLICT